MWLIEFGQQFFKETKKKIVVTSVTTILSSVTVFGHVNLLKGHGFSEGTIEWDGSEVRIQVLMTRTKVSWMTNFTRAVRY